MLAMRRLVCECPNCGHRGPKEVVASDEPRSNDMVLVGIALTVVTCGLGLPLALPLMLQNRVYRNMIYCEECDHQWAYNRGAALNGRRDEGPTRVGRKPNRPATVAKPLPVARPVQPPPGETAG